MDDPRVVVVGGGLGGLTAALLLAREGRAVQLFERASHLGGRGATSEEQGFRLNLGPHALYRGGAGMKILKRLGLVPAGGVPSPSGGYAVTDAALHALPGGMISLLSTGLLDLRGKLEAARWLTHLQSASTHRELDSISVSAWAEGAIISPRARALILALLRLSTYSADPDRESAGAALDQLGFAVRSNVLYLDGGWSSLIGNLAQAALKAGVMIEAGKRVDRVLFNANAVTGVAVEGRTVEAQTVILALPPADAERVLGSAAMTGGGFAADQLTPVRAACLDLCLRGLPDPRALFALGIDRPLYLSVHSAVAKLAPVGAAQVHLAKYLGPADHDPEADLAELETLADRIQPGWREQVVFRRWLPRMTVSHARVTAAAGGLSGRPAPVLRGARGVFLVGDWVGDQGMLADASFASASWVAEKLLRREPPQLEAV